MVPSYVCGAYLLSKGFKGKVYVFGSSGIEEELQRLNIRYAGFGPDPLPRNLNDFSKIELDPEIEAVIVGFDYDISYPKMIRAATYARRVPNEMFIATNGGMLETDYYFRNKLLVKYFILIDLQMPLCRLHSLICKYREQVLS